MSRIRGFSWLVVVALVVCALVSPAWPAVAFVTHTASTVTVTDTKAVAITVSGTNPVLGVWIGWIRNNSAIVSVTSDVDGALTHAGTATGAVAGNTAHASLYYKAAPTAGAHTITVVIDTDQDRIGIDAFVFSGAHQTTPVTDFTSSTTIQITTVLTPANLTADDATFGGGNYMPGDWSSAAPTQDMLDNSSNCTIVTGHATGTTGLTLTATNSTGDSMATAAIRIAAAAGGPTQVPSQRTMTGVGI